MATRILIVDDDLGFLQPMRERLEQDGYEVLAADGQVEAEKLLADQRPDLAIVNLMMEYPDSGFVLSYHIKKLDARIPVILLTAVRSQTRLDFGATTDEERAWVKADVLLDKPVRYEQLKREFEHLLHTGVAGAATDG